MRITFTEGWYNIKGQPTNVAGYSFDLVEDYKVAKSGEGYITVDGASVLPAGAIAFPDRSIRIKCRQGDYSATGETVQTQIPEGVSMLTALKTKSAKGVEVTDFTQVKVSDAVVAH